MRAVEGAIGWELKAQYSEQFIMVSTPSPLRRSAFISCVNRIGERLRKSGISKPDLVPEKLLSKAVKKMGLDDFGDPSFMIGLDMLTAGLREQAQLSQVGQILAYFNLLDYLCVRLALVDYRAGRPEVSARKIAQPLFILGLPRTGTTILYEIIAQDPSFRSPASWEVAKPMPPASEESYVRDKRIRAVDRELSVSELLAPGFKAIHATGARLPQECVNMFSSQFVSEQFGYMYNIPAYRSWAFQQDMTSTYRWHSNFLQHLQVDLSRERWVLKTPSHLAYLRYLFGQYPDAQIVWTHRDPREAVASFSSLVSTLQSGFSDAVDCEAVGLHESAHCSKMLKMGMEQRAELDTGQFFDVKFTDICSDPITVVQKIYERFDIALSPVAENRMRDYLGKRPRDLYGEHVYSANEFGLKNPQCEDRFSEYLSRFQPYCE